MDYGGESIVMIRFICGYSHPSTALFDSAFIVPSAIRFVIIMNRLSCFDFITTQASVSTTLGR